MTKEEYFEKYPETAFDNSVDEKPMVYSAALRAFDRLEAWFEQEKAGANLDYLGIIGEKYLEGITLIDLMISYTIPSKDLVVTDEIQERLLSNAQVITAHLTRTITVNGNVVSIEMHDPTRQQLVNKLKDIYSKVKSHDPSFVEPSLPPIHGVGYTLDHKPVNQSSGGCYVATAVYGSYDCPQVWTLRRYRDYTLAGTWYGRAIIRTYYAISPTLVKWFGETQWFKNMWKPRLDRMVKSLNAEGIADTPYQDKQW